MLADDALRTIAQAVLRVVRADVPVDWTVRENARARLRVLFRRVPRKHGYLPDRQEQAAHRALEQAGVLSELWVAA